MNLILLVIVILILLGEKLLLDYGECKVVIDQDGKKKEIVVVGGRSLLDCLTENKIDISSSCGGKSSCGYCKIKILKGGGEIFPQFLFSKLMGKIYAGRVCIIYLPALSDGIIDLSIRFFTP